MLKKVPDGDYLREVISRLAEILAKNQLWWIREEMCTIDPRLNCMPYK